jgi:hypothetical protein
MESNLDYFNSRPPLDSEFIRRLQALENQVEQLRKYQIKARPKKQNIILRLLARYEHALSRINFKLEKRSI